jgi:hypothetical protein
MSDNHDHGGDDIPIYPYPYLHNPRCRNHNHDGPCWDDTDHPQHAGPDCANVECVYGARHNGPCRFDDADDDAHRRT